MLLLKCPLNKFSFSISLNFQNALKNVLLSSSFYECRIVMQEQQLVYKFIV